MSVTETKSVGGRGGRAGGLLLVMFSNSVEWGRELYTSKAGNLAFMGCRMSARK